MKRLFAVLIFMNSPAFAMSPTLKDIRDRRQEQFSDAPADQYAAKLKRRILGSLCNTKAEEKMKSGEMVDRRFEIERCVVDGSGAFGPSL